MSDAAVLGAAKCGRTGNKTKPSRACRRIARRVVAPPDVTTGRRGSPGGERPRHQRVRPEPPGDSPAPYAASTHSRRGRSSDHSS
jgi:hypothetical protein